MSPRLACMAVPAIQSLVLALAWQTFHTPGNLHSPDHGFLIGILSGMVFNVKEVVSAAVNLAEARQEAELLSPLHSAPLRLSVAYPEATSIK